MMVSDDSLHDTHRDTARRDGLSLDDRVQPLLPVLLANIDGMVYRCRIDPLWAMEYLSEACFTLTRHAPEDLLQGQRASYRDLIHAEDRDRVRATILREVHEHGRYAVEYRIVCADGHTKWVSDRGMRLREGNDAVEGVIEDITARKNAFEALATAERRYRSLFENAVEGIYQTTLHGQFLSVNPALARMYGHDSPAELVAAFRDIGRELYVDPNRRIEFLRRMLETRQVKQFESEVRRKDGSTIWISETAHALTASDGSLMYFEGTVEDITERRQYHARLEHQATHDALTGLPNRALLEDRLRQAIAMAARTRALVAVAFIDLDRFKFINDSLGHAAGDALLKEVSTRLCHVLRETDTVARLGGDEFVVVLSNQPSIDAIAVLIERMIEEVARPVPWNRRELTVTCSLGVAVFPGDGRDVETLMRNADAAMYQAKEHGRNNFQLYTPSMNTAATERLALEAAFRRALQDDEIVFHFQPRIDLRTRRMCAMESLARWRNGEQGWVQPTKFIPLAEETGLIDTLGTKNLLAACTQAATLRTDGRRTPVVSINLSARQLVNPHLRADIEAALGATGLSARYLEIEISEKAVCGRADELRPLLREIKSLGVRLAIDDFGSGNASLRELGQLPIDTLKIDGSLVRDIATDARQGQLAAAIVTLAHSLQLRVVAEGVESREQLAFLRGAGCDEVQGFYIGKPMSGAELEAMLKKGQRIDVHSAGQ